MSTRYFLKKYKVADYSNIPILDALSFDEKRSSTKLKKGSQMTSFLSLSADVFQRSKIGTLVYSAIYTFSMLRVWHYIPQRDLWGGMFIFEGV